MTDTDQVARDNANKALASIEAHERVCTERQGHIIEGLAELKLSVRGLYSRFWAAALSIIGFLISISGVLLWDRMH